MTARGKKIIVPIANLISPQINAVRQLIVNCHSTKRPPSFMEVRNVSGCGYFDELGSQVVMAGSSISEKFILVQYDLINFAVYDSFFFHTSN